VLIFPFFFFFTFMYIETGYFANIYWKILFLAYDNAALFLRYSLPYFVFEIKRRNMSVGHAESMQYITHPHSNIVVHRCTSDVDCTRSTCETHFFLLVERAGDEAANALPGCFNGRHYWAKCVREKLQK